MPEPVAPLRLFSLPQELLSDLSLRNLISQPPVDEDKSTTYDATPIGDVRSCNTCLGVTFANLDAQRLHFQSDWHRYNVKMRLAGGKPVAEVQFASMLDCKLYILHSGLAVCNIAIALEDSISGSASSDDGEDDSDADAVNTLISRRQGKRRSPSPSALPSIPQLPVAWFHSPPSKQFGVYKTIFSSTSQDSFISELRAMQKPVPGGRRWAMFMVAGGHFAGMIVRVSRPATTIEH